MSTRATKQSSAPCRRGSRVSLGKQSASWRDVPIPIVSQYNAAGVNKGCRVGWFSRKKGAPDIARGLVAAYPVAFSADRFHSLFPSTALYKGQSMDFALAEWHAFGAFVITRCLWVAYGRNERVAPILDHFRPSLLDVLSLNKDTLDHFLEVASERERDYMERFPKTKDGKEISAFFSYVVAHITGHHPEASEFLGMPLGSDPAITLPLSQNITALMVATIERLKSV